MAIRTNLWLWAGRPLGPDPRAHYWWAVKGKHWIRLCDKTPWSADPANDFRMSFPVGCRICSEMKNADERLGLNRIKFRRNSPKDWRESYGPWLHNEENCDLVEQGMPNVPMSKLLDFCEAESAASRQRIVRDVKYKAAGGGGAPRTEGSSNACGPLVALTRLGK